MNQVYCKAIRANLKMQSAWVRRILRSWRKIGYEIVVTCDQPHATWVRFPVVLHELTSHRGALIFPGGATQMPFCWPGCELCNHSGRRLAALSTGRRGGGDSASEYEPEEV